MERLRKLRPEWPRRQAQEAPQATSDAPPAPAAAAGDTRGVDVIYGASVQSLALAGLTIAQARPLVETILAVDRRSPALVNGRPVRTSHVIAQGDVLEFVHHAGEKGALT
jgi:hypothetical protein